MAGAPSRDARVEGFVVVDHPGSPAPALSGGREAGSGPGRVTRCLGPCVDSGRNNKTRHNNLV